MRLLATLLFLSVPVLLAASMLCRAAEGRFRPFRQPFARFLLLPRPAQVFVACFVFAFVVYGSRKGGVGTNAPASRTSAPRCAPAVVLTQDQIDAGFALTRVGTNETWDFSAPDGAHVHAPWRLRGAAGDRFHAAFPSNSAHGAWGFPLGARTVDGLVVSSTGALLPKDADAPAVPSARLADLVPDGTNVPAGASVLAPLRAVLGIVPEGNWDLLPASCRPSEAWWCATPSNSLVVTWRNALLGREPASAVSFQAELFADGDFVFRYDLARAGLWNGSPVTNVLAGAFRGGRGESVDVSSVTNLTSLFWHALSPDDTPTGDRDGDGRSTAEEILLDGTDPGLADTDGDGVLDGEEAARGTDPLSRDSDGDGLPDGTDPRPLSVDNLSDNDGDGLPDAWKAGWFGANAVAAASDPGGDGIPVLAAFHMGVCPTNGPGNGFSASRGVAAGRMAAWEIVPAGFAFNRPAGLTNLVVRTFRVDRTSPWEQFYVSARPDAGEGWTLSGAELAWGLSPSAAGNPLPSSPDDSVRLALADAMPGEISVRLVATGPRPALSSPLYLIRWTPRVDFVPTASVAVLAATNGHVYAAAARNPDAGAYVLPVRRDLSTVPHRAGLDGDARADLARPPVDGVAFHEADGADGPSLRAGAPLLADLPPEGTNLPKRVLLYEIGVRRLDAAAPGPVSGRYAAPYPLSNRTLRRAFHDASSPAGTGMAEIEMRPKVPELGWTASGTQSPRNAARGAAPREGGDGVVLPADITPTLLGGLVTNGTEHVEGRPSSYDPVTEEDDETKEPEDDCECGGADASGGSSLGCFRIRIPLGAGASGQVAGYLWADVSGPAPVTPALFNVLAAPSVAVATNADGSVSAVCPGAGGKSVLLRAEPRGVSVAVTNASGRLEATWRVWNPEGDAARIRVRRETVSGNATVDETYEAADDYAGLVFGSQVRPVGMEAPIRVWTKTDNLSGVVRTKREWTDPDDPEFVSDEYEETLLRGEAVRAEHRAYERVGEGAFARRRLARTRGRDERGWYESVQTHWDDPRRPDRHGRLRSLRSDRESWRLLDYDGLGRETVRIEQLDGSPFPGDVFQAGTPDPVPDPAGGAPVPGALRMDLGAASARITLTSYEPHPGDFRDRNDMDEPRTVETYVRRDGGDPVLVARETFRFSRMTDASGNPLRRRERTLGFGGLVRAETEVAYPSEPSVPEHLRALPVRVVDADGVETATTYALADDVLVATERTFFGGRERKTYRVTSSDARFRMTLREETRLSADGTLLDWTDSAYDDVRRLRAKTCSDGTSETNDCSCCRLLWSRDRQGRKVLRSARTGSDHLYRAEEEVWLADVSTNGAFRVTQHFMDGLGRETNTVVYAATVPGLACDPVAPSADQSPAATATAYDDAAGDGRSVTVDARGKVVTRSSSSTESREDTYEVVSTNGAGVCETVTRTWRNGRTETDRFQSFSSEFVPGAWLRESRWTEWGTDGLRVDFASTWTDEYGVVTNSVVRHDALGRAVSEWTPLGTTAHVYDGASERRLASTTASGDVVRTTEYLYDALGEQVGTVEDGITNRTDVAYEMRDGAHWRVSTQLVAGPGTNSVAVTRERLTGLSDALRSCTETVGADGVRTAESVSFDPATGEETLVSESSVRTPVTTRRRCGVVLGTVSAEEETVADHDAFGRAVRTWRRDGDGPLRPETESAYSPAGDLVRLSTFTNGTDVVAETYACDAFGRRVSRTDALGHETRTVYDGWGRQVLVSGASYPVRQEYDAFGNRVALGTTRNGVDWDWTRWTYDPATRLCTSKTYADGSTVSYTHTPDGLTLRTTYASGRWTERVYDARRRLAGMRHSGGAPDAGGAPVPGAQDDSSEEDYDLVRDAYGMPVLVTDAAGRVARLAYADDSVLTNDAWTAAGRTGVFARSVDAFRRPSGYALSVDGVAKGGVGLAYDAEGRIGSVSATNAEGRAFSVAYTNCAGFSYGYAITLPNGGALRRVVGRDPHRRGLVAACRTYCNASEVDDYVYAFDADGRPVSRNGDVFGYDDRDQVTYAAVGTNVFTHAYDEIGNHVLGGANAETNTFVANCLNQRVSVLGASAPPRELSYAADGGLANDGRFAYVYDAEDRLVSVTSLAPTNGAVRVRNEYDWRSRRVAKCVDRYDVGAESWRAAERRDFVWDGWNIVHETVSTFAGAATNVTEVQYFWGPDLSGTLDGAGGVGGLLAVSFNGSFYFPVYDNNGNVMKYVDESGAIVAAYVYDDFGATIAQSGDLAGVFVFRFSTKYSDHETDLLAYQCRFYAPYDRRWVNRDPIEEDGGVNLYLFCSNNSVFMFDVNGERPRTLEEIEQKYRDMIKSARRLGYGVAADNMEYFLSRSQDERTLDWKWLRSYSVVRSAERRNLKRFETALKAVANSVPKGRVTRYYDYFDATGTAFFLTELYFASGTFTISSYGDFSLKRTQGDCAVEISGKVDHAWWDDYDWHNGLAAYVPGFGLVQDADAQRLEDAGRAKSFGMESEWTQNLVGEYRVRRFLWNSSKFSWGEPRGGNQGLYRTNGRSKSTH